MCWYAYLHATRTYCMSTYVYEYIYMHYYMHKPLTFIIPNGSPHAIGAGQGRRLVSVICLFTSTSIVSHTFHVQRKYLGLILNPHQLLTINLYNISFFPILYLSSCEEQILLNDVLIIAQWHLFITLLNTTCTTMKLSPIRFSQPM